MFTDYKAQVISAYKKKKALGRLPLNLLHSTPGKLRAECSIVISERYLRKDENTLKVFFGPRSDMTAYMQVIRKFDADKFKPLDNFLKGVTNDTEDKNIELLAMLIDFEPRPYQFNPQSTGDKSDSAVKNDDLKLEDDNTIPKQPVKVDDLSNKEEIRQRQIKTDQALYAQPNMVPKRKRVLKSKYITILMILLALLCVGLYVILHGKKNVKVLPAVFIGKQKCMYWTGVEYQPISCDKKVGDTLVVALDTVRLFHFKMITEPDTITEASVGKVWYHKGGTGLEFYTSGGDHPVYAGRRLQPLTYYMLNKYILNK